MLLLPLGQACPNDVICEVSIFSCPDATCRDALRDADGSPLYFLHAFRPSFASVHRRVRCIVCHKSVVSTRVEMDNTVFPSHNSAKLLFAAAFKATKTPSTPIPSCRARNGRRRRRNL